MLPGSYNGVLVVSSLIVAILASYTALHMVSRVSGSTGKSAVLWLVGGSFAMGFGIWSMHFIGMLAFSLPISLGYDIPLTLASLLIAIASSALALWISCQKHLPWTRLVLGGLLMGAGIASMHYTGMEALLMTPDVIYIPWIFAVSIAIAVLASGAALWIAFRLREGSEKARFARAGASLLMGCAIVGMHYTGMAAAQFPVGSFCMAANSGIDTEWLAILVIVVTLAVFAIAWIVSALDVRTNKLLATSLNQATSEWVELALHDNLTHLPNRALLNERLDQAIRKSGRHMQRFAVLFMDLDGFKSVNDLYGHHVGDLLLVEVSRRILDTTRSEDTAARLGGDEFVVLIDQGHPDDVAALAERLIESIGAAFSISQHTLHVSASIGIALFPKDGLTAHELMVNADAAMYHTKEQGRNGYTFFKGSMSILND
ncbi:diguanylate cyclase [Pseudomonas costantinii]|uniref:Diguanylate cyclase (GGDEF) domain-containing protein n=1 Tax=Pseudomonas costantinii TaxID=168469 RepID=A0A1H4YQS5_9PSED|nr:MHYT domain-containing protein [Pseudomonas costantinii]NVZ20819.1 diguanylate cyclase [Pseudomonas costantinii]SED20346.1 diguanylate cyclase (GGDEF) domain-containing protein [Pseudomonas costantinii]